jgi:DNA repair exonuclease SbcCD ATPase subunit
MSEILIASNSTPLNEIEKDISILESEYHAQSSGYQLALANGNNRNESEESYFNALYSGLSALHEKAEREKVQESCEYCKNPCWGCTFAGNCMVWKHCEENNRSDYEPSRKYCPMCGRKFEAEHE